MPLRSMRLVIEEYGRHSENSRIPAVPTRPVAPNPAGSYFQVYTDATSYCSVSDVAGSGTVGREGSRCED